MSQGNTPDLSLLPPVGAEEVGAPDLSALPPIEEEQVVSEDQRHWAVDMARAVPDGMRDAVQATIDSAGVAGDVVEENVLSAGGLVFGDEASNGYMEYLGPEEWAARKESVEKLTLPDFEGEADTTAGRITHDITQFITGMVGGSKILKTAGWGGKSLQSKITREIVAGGLSESVAMDAREEGLSDFLNKYPMMDNVIPDFLVTNPDDTEAEARVRRFFDGMAWGAVGESLFLGFKAMRAWRSGRKEEAEKLLQEADSTLPKAEDATSPAQPAKQAEEEVVQQVDEATPEPQVEIDNMTVVGDKTVEKFKARLKEVKTKQELDEALEGIDFNFSRMDSEDSVKQVLNTLSETIAPQLDRVKGGVRSLDETKALADILGEEPAHLVARMSKTFDSIQDLDAVSTAGRVLMQKLSDDVYRLSEIVDSPAATEAVKAQFIQQVKLLSEVTAMQKGMQTNIARALSAHRITTSAKGVDVDTKLLEEIIDGAGGSKKVRELASHIKLNRGDPRKMVKDLEQSWAGKVIDVHNEYWINSILSGITTHKVNMTSALIQSVLMPAERMIGAGLSGNKAGVREGAAHFLAMTESAWDSIKLGIAALRKGDNVLDTAVESSSKYEITTKAISSRNFGMTSDSFAGRMVDGLGTIFRLPSRFLLSEDEMFKQLNYRSRVRSKAYTEAWEQGLKGKEVAEYVNEKLAKSFDETGRAVDDEALQWAREATFTQELEYGAGKSIQTFMTKHPIARIVVPFVRTPTNLIRTAWQHAPLIQFTQKQLMADLKAGGMRAQLARGKIAVSNAIAVAAASMAMSGHITGGLPKNKAERDAKLNTGWQPYSFVVENEDGTKKYIPFGRLDPYGMLFGIVGDMHTMSDDLKDEDIEEIGLAMTAAIARNITSKTYLSNLAKTLDIISSGDPNKLERWMQYQASSYSWNLFNQMNDDPYMRDARTIADGILARNELTSDKVRPRRTVLGEPVQRSHHALPWQTADEKDEPVYQELANLGGAVAHPPTKMGKVDLEEFLNANGQDAWDRYMELQSTITIGGKTMKEQLHDLIQSDSYQSLPADTDEYTSVRHERIRKIVGRYRKVAERQLREEQYTFEGSNAGKTLKMALEEDRLKSKVVPRQGIAAFEALLNQ